jgi:integrase
MGKASYGTVQVKNSNNRLQLVFTYSSRRVYISLGLPDSKPNRSYAQMQARRIEHDILSGDFRPDRLDKYKPQKAIIPEAPRARPLVRELWERYTDFKRPQLSQTTIAVDFERVARHIEGFPCEEFDRAIEVRDHLLLKATPGQARKILKQLAACGSWAARSGLLETNPYAGMVSSLAKAKAGEEKDIRPFSPEERDRTIAKLKAEENHYAPLVEFLFRTGCRPSEGIAIETKHISSDYSTITFEQAITMGENGRTLKQGLKTQRRREFPCNAELRALLQSLVPNPGGGDTRLFTSPSGGIVDFGNFSSRVWHSTLAALGIDRRPIYQCRHTFITCCIEAGIDPKDIAGWVGNSPEIIYRHYAGKNPDIQPPSF